MDNGNEKSLLNTELPYKQVLGALMYSMSGTRLEVYYAIGVVFRRSEPIRVQRI